MMELVDKDIEAVIIILFHRLRKLEEWLDIDREDVKNDPNQIFRDENYNVWDLKNTEWD